MFNKQHYEIIAQIIKKEVWADAYDIEGIANVIQALADYFQQDNPLFDREKFYKACDPVED